MRRTSGGPPRVLFVSHQATRTGAPMVLLHLIRWVRANTDVEVEILLLRGGPLESDFRALGRTRVLRPEDDSSFFHKLEIGLEYIGLVRSAGRIRGIRYRVLLRRVRRVDLVYLNSVASFSLALYMPRGPHVVAHVHELEMGLRYGTPPSLSWPRLVEHVDLFIAAAECVAANLIENWGVPHEKVKTHHEFIDVSALDPISVALPVPAGAFVVGGCGTLEWRKGPDLFVQVAAVVRKRRPEVHFVWVGAKLSRDRWSVEHEIRSAGVGDRVHLVDETADAIAYLAEFDVLALTSREDPFPLVALEASAVGTPVVSFDNGGMRELLTPTCGRLVPYLDVEAMADAIVELVDHPETRSAVGDAAASLVSARHDVSVGAPRLWAEVLTRPSPAVSVSRRPPRAWWDSKASGVLVAAYATIAVAAPPARQVLGALAALVASAALLGAYAHVVDDSFDVAGDLAAAKPNAVATLRPTTRVALAVMLAVGGLVPWGFVDPGPAAWAVLAVIVALPLAYAAPRIRLKEHGAIGLMSDALMAHVAPTAFAVALFVHRTHASLAATWPLIAALLVWSTARGVRAILVHQLQDQDNDRAGAVSTFVLARGDALAIRLASRVFFPLEVAALAALALIGGARSPLIPGFAAAYAAVWVVARHFWSLPFVPVPARYGAGRMALERFSNVWPALVIAVWLVTQSPGYAALALALPILFRRSFTQEMKALGSRVVPFVWQVFARGRALAVPGGR